MRVTAVAGLVYDLRAVAGRLLLLPTCSAERRPRLYSDGGCERAAAVVCERMPEEAAAGVAYVVVEDLAGRWPHGCWPSTAFPSRELETGGYHRPTAVQALNDRDAACCTTRAGQRAKAGLIS